MKASEIIAAAISNLKAGHPVLIENLDDRATSTIRYHLTMAGFDSHAMDSGQECFMPKPVIVVHDPARPRVEPRTPPFKLQPFSE